jgi:hypothetical protein
MALERVRASRLKDQPAPEAAVPRGTSKRRPLHRSGPSKALSIRVPKVAGRLPYGAEICATGLTLPDNLDLDQWKAIGIKLCTIGSAVQWAIGDWWAYGHHAYGKRKAVAISKQLPYEFGSLMNLGSVARSVQTSCRNEVLSFSHHVAVAALEPEDQRKWLTRAAKGKLSVSKLRGYMHEAAERAKFESPGFDEAKSWVFGFLDRAHRARLCFPVIERSYLDRVSDSDVAELLEVVSKTADCWSEVTASLKEYQHERAAKC